MQTLFAIGSTLLYNITDFKVLTSINEITQRKCIYGLVIDQKQNILFTNSH